MKKGKKLDFLLAATLVSIGLFSANVASKYVGTLTEADKNVLYSQLHDTKVKVASHSVSITQVDRSDSRS